jgi:transcriptional regulator with XRE-family HTH domain
MDKFGKNISKIRKVKKLTQKMLAEDAKINYRHFQDIEGDKTDIRLSTATEIAKILGIPVSTLFHKNLNAEMVKSGIESFYDLVGKLPTGICISDLTGKIIFLNRYFYENLTFRTEEEVINGLYVWDLLPDDKVEEAKLAVDQIKVSVPKAAPRSRIYIGPDKRPLNVIVNWSYLKNSESEITGYVSTILEDVSKPSENSK